VNIFKSGNKSRFKISLTRYNIPKMAYYSDLYNETGFTGDFADVGDIEVGNIIITGSISINGDLDVPGNLLVEGDTTLQAVSATSVQVGDITITGTVTLAGDITVPGNLTVNGSTSLQAATATNITASSVTTSGNIYNGLRLYTNQIEPYTAGSTLIVDCNIDNSDPNDAVHRTIKTGSLITMYGIDSGGILGNAGDAGTSFYFSNSGPGDFCVGGYSVKTQLGANLSVGSNKSNLTLTTTATTANLPVSVADTTNSTSASTGSVILEPPRR
jgi:hypothetical protein